VSISAFTVGWTRPTEIAKPMFCALWMIAVLMPMTSPCALTSGPPELPGLIPASVCSASLIVYCCSLICAPCRKHAARHRRPALEVQCEADRHDVLADLLLLRGAEDRWHQVFGIDLQLGQVGRLVAPTSSPIVADRQRHGDAAVPCRCRRHHVVIRHDVPVVSMITPVPTPVLGCVGRDVNRGRGRLRARSRERFRHDPGRGQPGWLDRHDGRRGAAAVLTAGVRAGTAGATGGRDRDG
jgi:hypothetical protein